MKHKVYSTYEDFYNEYRWFKYNLINVSLMGKKELNLDETSPIISHNLHNYPKIVERGIKNYNKNNFRVKNSHIIDYEVKYVRPQLKRVIKEPIKVFGFTVSFVESFKTPLNPDKNNYLDKVKKRLIYYNNWDKMTRNQLIERLSWKHGIFLNSTLKLLGSARITKYLQQRFRTKEDLIETLLSNLVLDDDWINQKFRDQVNGNFVIDYPVDNFGWFFGNNFKRSIRVFENELRVDSEEKTIGSFYNEDILFKTLLNEFGGEFNVVSQGSPMWLRPQRLDIYFPELNIGVEYQGEQHYRPVDFGGKGKKESKKQFRENQYRDELKRQKCKENNCILLEMKYDDDLKQFIKKVKKVIKEKH